MTHHQKYPEQPSPPALRVAALYHQADCQNYLPLTHRQTKAKVNINRTVKRWMRSISPKRLLKVRQEYAEVY